MLTSRYREATSNQGILLNTVEMMRQALKETLKETNALSRVAIEEEVLIGAENIGKTSTSALRYATRLQNLLSGSKSNQIRRHG